MATAGDIVVNLTANSKQFNAVLSSAQGALSSLSSAVKVAGAAVAGFLSFQAVKGGIGTLTETIKKMDAIGDEAKKIGIPVQFLSELQHAAVMTDVSVDGLTSGFRKMEATLGGAGFKGNPAEAFLEIADVIKNTKGQFEQADIAKKIFGKGGVELLPLLREGRSGIMGLAKEAQNLGISIDDGMRQKVDAADDAFKRMDASMEGLKNTVAISLAPIFSDTLAPAILDLTQQTREWITSTEGIETMTGAWESFAGAVAGLADGLEVAGTAMGNFGRIAGATWKLLQSPNVQETLLSVLAPGVGLAKDIFGGGGKDAFPIDKALADFNSIFDQLDLKEPKVFGERVQNFLKDLAKPKGEGPIFGPPEPPGKPFAPPEPIPVKLANLPANFKTGETDVFSKEGFSLFARAVNGPSINIQQKQLDEQKKANGKLGDIVAAIKAIPEPAGPGEDF